MPAAQIKSTVLGAPIVGSRDDVKVGNVVTLEHNGSATSWLWELFSQPPGSTATLSSTTAPNPTFTPDKIGSYIVRLTVDGDVSGIDARVIGVKTAALGIRIPANNESIEYDNNVLDPTNPGWHEAMYLGLSRIDEYASSYMLKTDGSALPTENINLNNKSIINLAAPVSANDAARKADLPLTLPPTVHGLGDLARHSSATLAQLNTLISDARLVTAADADGYNVKVSSDDTTPGTIEEKFGVGLNIEFSTLNPASNETFQISTLEFIALPKQISSPSASTLEDGYLFSQDVSGVIELHYIDENGLVTQITESGGLFGLGSGTGGKVKVSANDAYDGYLFEKLVEGLNINLVEINDGYSEELIIETNEVLQLPEQVSDPTFVANDGYLYTKDVAAVTELFYMDDSGSVVQLTANGSIAGLDAATGGLVKVSANDAADGYLDGKLVAGLNTVLTENNDGGVETLTVATTEVIGLPQQASFPSAIDNYGSVYSKSVDGYAELFYSDDYGTAIQLTNRGIINEAVVFYEEEFLASAGANEFTLSAVPAPTDNSLSGREISGVYRNGVRSRYKSGATLAMEYDQSGGTDKINVPGQTGGEIFTVVFGV